MELSFVAIMVEILESQVLQYSGFLNIVYGLVDKKRVPVAAPAARFLDRWTRLFGQIWSLAKFDPFTLMFMLLKIEKVIDNFQALSFFI